MFVLKSYVHRAATFGDISRAFRSALSSVVSLYSATGVNPTPVKSMDNSLSAEFEDFLVSFFLSSLPSMELLQGNFFLFPSM